MTEEQRPGLILTLANGVQHPVEFETTADAEAAIDDFIDGGSRLGRDWIRADNRTAVARAHVVSVTVVDDLGRQTSGGRYATALKTGGTSTT
jgi:hypothetical protein